jgi:hypothetical protein
MSDVAAEIRKQCVNLLNTRAGIAPFGEGYLSREALLPKWLYLDQMSMNELAQSTALGHEGDHLTFDGLPIFILRTHMRHICVHGERI